MYIEMFSSETNELKLTWPTLEVWWKMGLLSLHGWPGEQSLMELQRRALMSMNKSKKKTMILMIRCNNTAYSKRLKTKRNKNKNNRNSFLPLKRKWEKNKFEKKRTKDYLGNQKKIRNNKSWKRTGQLLLVDINRTQSKKLNKKKSEKESNLKKSENSNKILKNKNNFYLQWDKNFSRS